MSWQMVSGECIEMVSGIPLYRRSKKSLQICRQFIHIMMNSYLIRIASKNENRLVLLTRSYRRLQLYRSHLSSISTSTTTPSILSYDYRKRDYSFAQTCHSNKFPSFRTMSTDRNHRSSNEIDSVSINPSPENDHGLLSQYNLPTIWGGTGVAITTLHSMCGIPYWGTCVVMALSLRAAMFPIVVKGAQAAADLAKVSPEVQFLMSIYVRDQAKLKAMKASVNDRTEHMKLTLRNLRGIYKRYNVNPLNVILAQLVQLPFFIYFATDIRKIINGLDVELKESLTHGGALWFTDLTQPDSYYTLPILSGVLLYVNVEFAVGKKSLAGEATSKSNIAIVLKDVFQSLSVFMPIFASTQPAMVQIYLVTSFSYSIVQGALMRNDNFRQTIGLPSLDAKPLEPLIAKSYMAKVQKDIEKENMESAPAGSGVIAPSPDNGNIMQTSVGGGIIGSKRDSTINISKQVATDVGDITQTSVQYIPDKVMEAANKAQPIDFNASKRIVMIEKDTKEDSSIDGSDIIRRRKKRKSKKKR